MADKQLKLIITGRVQGVCFRDYTVKEARRLGLGGWVRNLYDGSVEALAEGEEAVLRQLELWCWQGSPAADVSGVAATWGEAEGGLRTFSRRPNR